MIRNWNSPDGSFRIGSCSISLQDWVLRCVNSPPAPALWTIHRRVVQRLPVHPQSVRRFLYPCVPTQFLWKLGGIFQQSAPARSLLPELRRFGLRIRQPQHELWLVEQFLFQSTQPNGLLPHLRIFHDRLWKSQLHDRFVEQVQRCTAPQKQDLFRLRRVNL